MVKARAKLDPARVQLQLKVTLLDIQPPIWRRLLVPAKIKLPKLHTALQRAFGWTNSHLHAFRTKEASYEAFYPDDWSGDVPSTRQRYDEKKFRLCDLRHAKEDQLIYLYDFGDGWRHEVLVEDLIPSVDPARVTCLAGARTGPPEDCGGIPGFENLIEAMADPKHPERQELLDWIGKPFDPEAFNLNAINLLLKSIKT
jgi:hypothetical protein